MTRQPDAMADVRDMYMIHTMFRREFGLIPGLLRGVSAGDKKRSEVVSAHIDLLCRFVHIHHDGEDSILWPKLRERGGDGVARIVSAMEEQHRAIEVALGRVAERLPAWRATARGGMELARAFENLFIVLTEHLATEEQRILPLAEKYITAAEWKSIGNHGMNVFSKKELPLCFGLAMYEADLDVVKGVLADAPLPARLLIPFVAPRVFASHAKRVHGTATPPRIRNRP